MYPKYEEFLRKGTKSVVLDDDSEVEEGEQMRMGTSVSLLPGKKQAYPSKGQGQGQGQGRPRPRPRILIRRLQRTKIKISQPLFWGKNEETPIMASIEAKYGGGGYDDIDDEAFAAAQRRLARKNEESSDEACALFGYVSKMNLRRSWSKCGDSQNARRPDNQISDHNL